MHCQVSFLHGTPSEDGGVTMSLQSIPDIAACIGAGLAIAGAIAIAVDWPARPAMAKIIRRKRRKRVTM
jgi:hypothetical protein